MLASGSTVNFTLQTSFTRSSITYRHQTYAKPSTQHSSGYRWTTFHRLHASSSARKRLPSYSASTRLMRSTGCKTDGTQINLAIRPKLCKTYVSARNTRNWVLRYDAARNRTVCEMPTKQPGKTVTDLQPRRTASRIDQAIPMSSATCLLHGPSGHNQVRTVQ